MKQRNNQRPLSLIRGNRLPAGVPIIQPKKEPKEQEIELGFSETHVLLKSSAPINKMQFTPDQARGFAEALLKLADMVEEKQSESHEE